MSEICRGGHISARRRLTLRAEAGAAQHFAQRQAAARRRGWREPVTIMDPPTGESAEPTGAPMRGGREQRTICFDCSKREIFTPSTGLKALRRRLQNTYRVTA